MSDNTRGGSQDGANPLIATDEVTYSGDTADVQLIRPVHVTGSEGAKTVVPATVTEDDPLGSNGTGTLMMARRDDALTTLTPAEDDAVGLRTNSVGALWVREHSTIRGVAAINEDDSVTDDATLQPSGWSNVGSVAGAVAAVVPYYFDGSTYDRARGTSADGALVNLGANNDVTVTSMPNVTLAAGTNTNEVVGDVAHSAGVAGNPVLVSGVSQDSDDTAPPNRVDAESDTTRLATDRDGSLFVRPHGPQSWSYHLNTSTAQTDTTVHAAPGSGLSLYVGTIVFSSGAATAINLFFEEGASTVLGPYYLEAVAGRGMAVQFNPPKKITANTALTLTTSASIAHSVDVTGFTAQG